MQRVDALIAEALAIRELKGTVLDATDIGTHAIEYAVNNWAVFPLNGKIPAIAGGRGVLDATTDIDQIAQWWGGRYAGCNVGARLPQSMIVIDIDPRHGGDRSIAELEQRHGQLPDTLTTISGRGDGGRHLFFRRPSGKLTSKRFGPGVDLKTSAGYVVMPPSIHPDTGKPYVRLEAPVAAPPAWLVGLLKPEQPAASSRSPRRHLYGLHGGPSVADQFTVKASWERSSDSTAGIASTPTPRQMVPAGSTPTPPRPVRRRSGTAACSSTHRTPRSTPPSRGIRTATPSFVPTPSLTTTATSRPQPRHYVLRR